MDSILENIVYVPCDPSNHGGTRTKGEIKYLVYHYTANDGDRAINNCMYYKNNVVKASAHYFVDDDCVMQSVPDLVSAWAVGGKKWNDCAETGGGKLFGTVTNRNSISIELCDTKKDGVVMAQPATLDNGIALGKMLMAKYDIPIERVIRHFDVTGKHCPKYFMDETKWAAFKARLIADEKKEDEVEKRYNTIAEISDACPWATETAAKLIEKGCLNGGGLLRDAQGRPADLDLTRDMLRLLVINDNAGLYE